MLATERELKKRKKERRQRDPHHTFKDYGFPKIFRQGDVELWLCEDSLGEAMTIMMIYMCFKCTVQKKKGRRRRRGRTVSKEKASGVKIKFILC